MSSVEKYTNVLDNKKEAVVTTSLSENKLLKTEKVTTSDDVHKRTEKITTSEEVDKGYENFEDMKEAVVMIRRKDSDKFEGQSKGSTGCFNLDHDLKKIKFSTLEPEFYKKYMKSILKV